MDVEWRPAGAFEQRVTVLTFSLVQAMLLESRSRYAFSQSLYVFNRAPLSEPVFGRQSTLLRVERTHYKDENSLLPRSWGVHIVPVDTTRLQVHIRLNARIKPFAAVLRPQFIGAFSLLFNSTVLRIHSTLHISNHASGKASDIAFLSLPTMTRPSTSIKGRRMRRGSCTIKRIRSSLESSSLLSFIFFIEGLLQENISEGGVFPSSPRSSSSVKGSLKKSLSSISISFWESNAFTFLQVLHRVQV